MGEYKYFKRTRRQKRPETMSVGDGIQKILDVYKIRNKYDQERIRMVWEKVMSKMIASRTRKLSLKDGKLYVEFDSAPLKNELMGSCPKMIELLNAELKSQTVKEIVLL